MPVTRARTRGMNAMATGCDACRLTRNVGDPLPYGTGPFVGSHFGRYNLQTWRPPAYGVTHVWADDSRTGRGFLVVRATAGTATTKSRLQLSFFNVGQIDRGRLPWTVNWTYPWALKDAVLEKEPNECPVLECRHGPCVELEPPYVMHHEPSCDSKGYLFADTWEQSPRCSGEDQLISAEIQAQQCCPNPPCDWANNDSTCGFIAKAYVSYGRPLATVCLGWAGIADRLYGTSGCIFGRFTVPSYWVIRPKLGTTYELTCPFDILYRCCNCNRTYLEVQELGSVRRFS